MSPLRLSARPRLLCTSALSGCRLTAVFSSDYGFGITFTIQINSPKIRVGFEVVGILFDRCFVFLDRVLRIPIALKLNTLVKMTFGTRRDDTCLCLRARISRGSRSGRRLLSLAGNGCRLLLREAGCGLRLRSVLSRNEGSACEQQARHNAAPRQSIHFIFHGGLQKYIADDESMAEQGWPPLLLLRLDLVFLCRRLV